MTSRRIIPPERSTVRASSRWSRAMNFRSSAAAARRLGRRDVEVAGEDDEVLEDRQVRIEVVLLLADADPGLHGAGLPRHIQAEDPERPRGRRREAVDHPDRGGLSRPVGAEDPEALAGGDRKGEVVDGDKLPECLAEMLCFDDRAHRAVASAPSEIGDRIRSFPDEGDRGFDPLLPEFGHGETEGVFDHLPDRLRGGVAPVPRRRKSRPQRPGIRQYSCRGMVWVQ